MGNQTLLFLKTTTEKADALFKELKNEGYSFQNLARARMIVDNTDLDAIRGWFLERGVDSMCAHSLCAVKDTEETFRVHPSYFLLSDTEALLYQHIMDKYDLSAMDINVRNLHNAVLDLILKEEQSFCKENGIYDNYDWELYQAPFLRSGIDRLLATLKVKILNEKGYKTVKDGKIDYNKDICINRFVYVRKEEPKKKSLDDKIHTASICASAQQSTAHTKDLEL